MPYRAPVSEYLFTFDHVVGLDQVAATELFAEATGETVEAILSEAGKMCTDILAPLNRNGDLHPARLENGVVRTSPGFADGFRAIATGGWIGMAADPEHGGMGLPFSIATAVNEMVGSACLALQLNPLMTQGQIEALEHHASDAIKALYIPKLISGEWCGTMNLTESGAGSDVGALRTRAERNGDGTYAITGQKIFITWGDNDFAQNICHLVLARLPDGAPGTRGISLFMVPKFIPDAAGNPGPRNSLGVVSLEHKLGLHGSPTALMDYAGATGWLIGEEHKGMAAMFTMMNNARLGVGMQGVAVAEAAFQKALDYAQERKQGKTPLGAGAIIDHADVRRMLAVMKTETFSARAIGLACAVALDMARATGSADWAARAALLTPIAKAFGTDIGNEVAQLGLQVHGGMGFIEETGAAQFARDVRVTSIYEGTNGIQAMDLVGRKMMDGGAAAQRLLQEIEDHAGEARAAQPDLASAVWNAAEALRDATDWLVGQEADDRNAGATAYLRAFARVLGGHYHLKAALADLTRLPLAAVAIKRLLPEHLALIAQMREGAAGIYALTPERLAS
ncbi:acyl-CoA dehydrogenase [Gemmobacter serpentinus]|uniref:acyl-CoA dehydrogenase n=1 Tax=Gemmobacter serpentinus TaxID=2652247 RepID=UPI00124C4F68|nr:acyl-CoA dehydrogenase [Gemmobacter serpentinus]